MFGPGVSTMPNAMSAKATRLVSVGIHGSPEASLWVNGCNDQEAGGLVAAKGALSRAIVDAGSPRQQSPAASRGRSPSVEGVVDPQGFCGEMRAQQFPGA